MGFLSALVNIVYAATKPRQEPPEVHPQQPYSSGYPYDSQLYGSQRYSSRAHGSATTGNDPFAQFTANMAIAQGMRTTVS